MVLNALLPTFPKPSCLKSISGKVSQLRSFNNQSDQVVVSKISSILTFCLYFFYYIAISWAESLVDALEIRIVCYIKETVCKIKHKSVLQLSSKEYWLSVQQFNLDGRYFDCFLLLGILTRALHFCKYFQGFKSMSNIFMLDKISGRRM